MEALTHLPVLERERVVGWGGQRGDVSIQSVSIPVRVRGCVCVCLYALGAARPLQPLPHSTPLEQIACHRISITRCRVNTPPISLYTPSSTRVTHGPPPHPHPTKARANRIPGSQMTRPLRSHPLALFVISFTVSCFSQFDVFFF